LHYYRPQNVRTANGALGISSELKSNLYRAFDEDKEKYFADAKNVQSGMVQGWNKFCMTGGIVEFSAKLPGDPSTGGLWPALWMLGNLARATYVGSSNYIWPYSYDRCDEKNRVSQKISACSKVGHFGMEPGVGRGSPEIDILEAMMGSPETLPSTNITRPYFSSSLQIAPGYDGVRPNMGKMPKKVSEISDVLSFRPSCTPNIATLTQIANQIIIPSGPLVRRAGIRIEQNAVESILLRCDSRAQAHAVHVPIRCVIRKHTNNERLLQTLSQI
jgi:hypothetical protein